MKSPCELIVWYVLPSIRSELARELLSSGLTQKEVSEKLGITQPAISQYLGRKRGKEIKFKGEIKEEIRRLARNVAEGADLSELVLRICRICMKVRRGRALCELHSQQEDVPDGCRICIKI
jgi:hypothetical protein